MVVVVVVVFCSNLVVCGFVAVGREKSGTSLGMESVGQRAWL